MSNLNWCTFCDNAINPFSNSLYCSEACLRGDALNHHPLLGYDFSELQDFPRRSSTSSTSQSPALSISGLSSASSSPIPSYTLPSALPPSSQMTTPQLKLSPPLFELNQPALVKRPMAKTSLPY
ncbi:hypothetical protein INT43_009036 [Umbelopsis isabellina]|uniref:Uncharacterized protein n=1 Tax=Mortierella isabellina TaxID=91625 RepID=A0A8H7PCK1_MORIS|nr:hypothetical protein INT43_009036 [Umbelopsis isabellina]